MLLTSGEIKRTRGRFVLLTLGAGLLVFVLLFQQLLLDGMVTGFTGATKTQSGLVMVFNAEAKRNIAGGFAPSQEVRDALAAHASVADVAGLRLNSVPFRAESGAAVKDAMIFGYEDGRPGMPQQLASGNMPTGPGELIADTEGSNSYKLGDTITIEPAGLPMTIVGLTSQARYNASPTFWTTADGYKAVLDAARVLDLGPQVLVLQPREGAGADVTAAELSTAFPELDIVSRQTAAETAPGIKEIQVMFSMILGLCYLVVGIVIAFFFLTLTLQKKSALTLLRAVGAPNGYLVKSLLQQVLLVTLGGLAVGMGLLALSVVLTRNLIPLTMRPAALLQCSAMALIVALLGAIPPMRRILRTDPFDVVGRPSLGGLG